MKLQRFVATAMTVILSLNIVGCSMESAKETVTSAANTAQDAAITAKDSVVNWYSNLDFSKFEEGWNYSVEFMGAQYAAVVSSEYVANVEAALS